MDDNQKKQYIAEELARKLDDEHSVGFYRKLANEYNNDTLTAIANSLSDYPNARNKGALFTWFLKKNLGISSLKSGKTNSELDRFEELKTKARELAGGKGI